MNFLHCMATVMLPIDTDIVSRGYCSINWYATVYLRYYTVHLWIVIAILRPTVNSKYCCYFSCYLAESFFRVKNFQEVPTDNRIFFLSEQVNIGNRNLDFFTVFRSEETFFKGTKKIISKNYYWNLSFRGTFCKISFRSAISIQLWIFFLSKFTFS